MEDDNDLRQIGLEFLAMTLVSVSSDLRERCHWIEWFTVLDLLQSAAGMEIAGKLRSQECLCNSISDCLL